MPGGSMHLTRAGAVDATDQRARLERAARGFEEFFIKQMLEHARGGLFERDREGLFDSPALDQFEQLHHDALAEHTAGGLGVAEMLVQYLTARGAVPAEAPDRPATTSGGSSDASTRPQADRRLGGAPEPGTDPAPGAADPDR